MSTDASKPKGGTAWIDSEAVMGILGISPNTLYAYIDQGKIPAYRLGRQWRFRPEEIDEYLSRTRTVRLPADAPKPKPRAQQYIPKFDHFGGSSSPRTRAKDSSK